MTINLSQILEEYLKNKGHKIYYTDEYCIVITRPIKPTIYIQIDQEITIICRDRDTIIDLNNPNALTTLDTTIKSL